MKFLLDESADFVLAGVLTDLGHDAKSIVHDYPRALGDEEVLALARNEGRILLTNYRDFGELIFRRQLKHAGVILFRLELESVQIKTAWFTYILDHYNQYLGSFIVVSENGVRVRNSD